MRKKALLTTLAATAAMAFAASNAQAAVLADDGQTGDLCSSVSLSGNTVTGGCLIEDMSGSFTLRNGQTVYTGCTADFDVRMQANLAYYAVNPVVRCDGSSRRACTDDVTGEVKPWASGPTHSTLNMCLELPAPGGDGSDNTVPVNFAYTITGGQVLSMTQTSAPNGIGDAYFANQGATDEVDIYNHL